MMRPASSSAAAPGSLLHYYTATARSAGRARARQGSRTSLAGRPRAAPPQQDVTECREGYYSARAKRLSAGEYWQCRGRRGRPRWEECNAEWEGRRAVRRRRTGVTRVIPGLPDLPFACPSCVRRALSGERDDLVVGDPARARSLHLCPLRDKRVIVIPVTEREHQRK